MASTPPKECHQNIEVTNKEEESKKTSCEHAIVQQDSKVQQDVNSSDDVEEVIDEENSSPSCFTTPKDEIFKIPKVLEDDCPPAPPAQKKRRSLLVNDSSQVKIEEQGDEENMCSSGFTTPKGKEFRIPKVSYDNCPPAPMRSRPVRTLDHSPSNTKVFASAEIDSFFIHSKVLN
ncbi:unnamed protein product [Trifolium pratense]|uniref:Uncharacterized protein n=1 Tax=Trifolium pratense TaxID=57577 RepID=A0ACB0LSK4_TRIPR|nr:unnamed protein product [Trifolium pratense]